MSLVSFTQCDAPLCTAQFPTPSVASMKGVREHRAALEDAGWSWVTLGGLVMDLCPEHDGMPGEQEGLPFDG